MASAIHWRKRAADSRTISAGQEPHPSRRRRGSLGQRGRSRFYSYNTGRLPREPPFNTSKTFTHSRLAHKGDSFNRGAILVEDGQIVLIRGEFGYGVIRPISQFEDLDEERQTIEYKSWFARDLSELASLLDELVAHHGSSSEGNGLPSGAVHAGPYELPWSYCSPGRGWFYYREYNGGRIGRSDYELSAAGSEPVDLSYFSGGIFQRGAGEVR